MRSRKKWMVFACIMAMLVMSSFLAACNKVDTSGVKTTTETTKAETTKSGETTTTKEKVTESGWYDEPVDLYIDTPAAVWAPNINEAMKLDPRMDLIREKFNINEIICNPIAAEDQQKLILNLAAGTSGDMVQYGMWPRGAEYTTMGAEEDLFVDFNELTAEYPGRYPVMEKIISDPGYKFACSYLYNMADKAYGYWDYNANTIPEGGILFNMKIMEKIGKTEADIPTTLDEFIQLLRDCRAADPDIIPFAMDARKGTRWDNFNTVWFQTNGQQIDGMVQVEDGTWYDAAVDPKNIPIWKLLQQAYAEGLLYQEMFTIENYSTDVFVEGNMLCHDTFIPHFGVYQKTELAALQDLDSSYTSNDLKSNVNPLKGPGGEVTQNWVEGALFAKTVIPRTSKQPERALDLINYLTSLEGQVLIQYGIEGLSYSIDTNGNYVRIKEEADKLKDLYDQKVDLLELGYMHGAAWGFIKDFESNSYLSAGLKGVSVTLNDIKKEAMDGNDPMLKNWLDSYNGHTKDINIMPFWKGTIYSSSTMDAVFQRMIDVKNEWFMKFVIGEKDPETDWEAFVEEYNSVGAAGYLSDYQKNAGTAEKMYKSVMN